MLMTKNMFTIQENGRVVIPMALRKRYRFNKGDVVTFEETDDGLLIRPQEAIAMKLLDDIGDALKAKGITLEELMESGRRARGELLKEKYDLEANEDA